MSLSISEQRHAVDLADRCIRVLALDVIWTGRLAESDLSDASREDLAGVGHEMVAELEAIRHSASFVRDFAKHATHDTSSISPDLGTSLNHIANDAARYIEEYGQREIDYLVQRSEILLKGGVPEGDLPRRLTGALCALSGLLLISGGAGSVFALGPAGAMIAAPATTVGSALFGRGVGILLESREEKKREDEVAKEAEEMEERARKAAENEKASDTESEE
ncbi:hypothetical protein ACQEVG_20745 [Streptomyces sp. CA-135486]|uniref:hypothetical protein n=1 Tax=Streptomyces sp. CA-135486 TaxID=3240049 RepID=UPI003D8F608E